MKIKKINYKMFISLFLFWMLLTCNFQLQNFIIGIIVTNIIIYIFETASKEKKNNKKITFIGLFKFVCMTIYNIYKSSILYMEKIFKNQGKAHVLNIDIGIKRKQVAILIANAITLTPGTITLKIFDNNSLKVLIQVDSEIDIENFRKEINAYKRVLENGE